MRLFVAVLLPETEQDRIDRALQPIRELGIDVRWLARDSFHLTLMFLGEVSDARVNSVRDTLATAAANQSPFTVGLGGFGALPNLRRARVWWVGMEATAPLLGLQHGVETALSALGFRAEERAYHPHLTVARAKPDTGSLPANVADAAVQRFDYHSQLHVDCVHLMRSRLQRGGAQYQSIARLPFTRPSNQRER
jgi:2'-5' RNA ligase